MVALFVGKSSVFVGARLPPSSMNDCQSKAKEPLNVGPCWHNTVAHPAIH